jgi:hypothetical protein
MDYQTIIVTLIVAASLGYIAKVIFKSFKGKTSGGCDNCGK